MRYKHLCNKYNITEEEVIAAVEQIKLGSIACDGLVLVALCKLLINGDIPGGCDNAI